MVDAYSSVGGTNVTFISWNVRGMGHQIKRGKVFAYLKSLSADIIFLQETHIKQTEQRRLRSNWISQVYQSSFSSKARGVAILFCKSIPFRLSTVSADPSGRYILVSGHINSFPITCLNIYGPNFDDPNFFRKVFDLLPDPSSTNIIIGGDFNCYLDAYLDRSSTQAPHILHSVSTLNHLCKSLNLVDIWRLQNPSARDYSFFSSVHKSYTRIDYFLVDSKLISNVIQTKYNNIIISDHSPISMVFKLSLLSLSTAGV